MAGVSDLPLADLAQRCAEETDRFLRQHENDRRFCFELMRRALADDLTDAFTYIYRIYEQQVSTWVYRHSRFQETGESAEYFVGWAMRAFYFRARGARFEAFPTIAHLMAYIKRCVHTAIAQYLRDQDQLQAAPLDMAAEAVDEAGPEARVHAAELWARVLVLLPEERDQRLARCALVLGMRPQQILAAEPGLWADERAISVALYRIRRVLRRDPELRAQAGLDAGDAGTSAGN